MIFKDTVSGSRTSLRNLSRNADKN